MRSRKSIDPGLSRVLAHSWTVFGAFPCSLIGLYPGWIPNQTLEIKQMRDVTMNRGTSRRACSDAERQPRERGKCSTSDILGNDHRNGVKAKWAVQHKRLTDLRDKFLSSRAALSESAKETRTTASSEHIADSATDSYDRDWALAMLSSDQNALYEIDQALNRIQSGTYGICELSGKPIEQERLRAIPWARFSAAAQIELEWRNRSTQRMRLGEVGSCAAAGGSQSTDDADELEAAA